MAGTTASHNRAGQYLRSRRVPVVPTRTPKQGILRTQFGEASRMFQSLTAALQAAWTSFAANYPVVDSLGQTVVLTAQQFFVGIQTQLLHIGQTIQTAIPTNTTVNAPDTPTLYADASGTVIVGVNSITAGDFVTVGCSKLLSNGKNYNKTTSNFAVLGTPNLLADISAAFAAQFGAPTLGRKLFAAFRSVNSSGLSGSPVRIQAPVSPTPTLPAPVASSIAANTVVVSVPPTGTYTVALFQVNPDGSNPQLSSTAAAVAAPGNGFPTTTGLYYVGRVFDGTQWSPPSNVQLSM